jgi:hypothetical protein
MLAAWPALAADVTPDRLVNADKEPQNWLMNHRTYDGQRFSPLARINRDNVKNLKLAYAVPLGGGAGNEFANATPLAEDGFLYVTDSWNVLYKIDASLSPSYRSPSRCAGSSLPWPTVHGNGLHLGRYRKHSDIGWRPTLGDLTATSAAQFAKAQRNTHSMMGSAMLITGRCHCGNISLALDWRPEP